MDYLYGACYVFEGLTEMETIGTLNGNFFENVPFVFRGKNNIQVWNNMRMNK